MQERVTLFRPPAWAQDVLLAVFITVMQVQGTVVRNGGEPEAVLRPLSDLGNLGYLLLVTGGAVLVWRRRRPVAVFVVTALASMVYYALDFPDGPTWLGLFVALYTLTARGDGRRSLVVAGVGIAALSAVWLLAAADIEPPRRGRLGVLPDRRRGHECRPRGERPLEESHRGGSARARRTGRTLS